MVARPQASDLGHLARLWWRSWRFHSLHITVIRGHDFFFRWHFNFNLIVLLGVIEINVDLCFSLIVPLKAMIDDQSFVPVSAYYSSCLRITVTCGHCVYLLKYMNNIYCKRVRVLQLYADTPFLRISPRNQNISQNCFSLFIRNTGVVDSWKKNGG